MMTARLSSWHRNEGHLRPLQAAAAQKVTAFSRSPWRFVTSAYLAGAAIAFMYLAASAVRAPLAALAPGSELLAIPLVIASGLSALVLLGRLDLSVGTGALLAVCRLEGQDRTGRCTAAVLACAAANLVGSVTVAALMARAGMLERLVPTMASVAARRMVLPPWQSMLQSLLGGWLLGLVVLIAALAPGARWRFAIVWGGLFLFVASGFRLASADAALNVPAWTLGSLPGLRGGHLLAHLILVALANLVGAAALAGGLLWLAAGGQRAKRTLRLHHHGPVLPAVGAVRMHPAIIRPLGSVRRP